MRGKLSQIDSKKNPEALAGLTAEQCKEAKGKSVPHREHHLRQYTARNTRDLFMHMDLKGFLFVSIDDNQLENLYTLFDHSWENRGSSVCEKKKRHRQLSPIFRDTTEYVLDYTLDTGKIGQLYGEDADSGKWQFLGNRANQNGC